MDFPREKNQTKNQNQILAFAKLAFSKNVDNKYNVEMLQVSSVCLC